MLNVYMYVVINGFEFGIWRVLEIINKVKEKWVVVKLCRKLLKKVALVLVRD